MPAERRGRRTAIHLLSWCLAAAVVAIGLSATRWLPDPARAWDALLRGAQVPALALIVGLVLVWSAATAILALRDGRPLVVLGEEPLLPEPRLPSVPAQRTGPVTVGVIDLQRGAGASTLACNLAVLLATVGTARSGQAARRPRTVCLLAEGRLTKALELNASALGNYLAAHPFRVTAEVVNHTTRHPSGAEFLCLGRGGHVSNHLHPLLAELGHHYDVVFVDSPRGDWHLADVTVRASDVLLLIGLPTAASEDTLCTWAERVWSAGREQGTAFVLNRARASATAGDVPALLLHEARIPDQPQMAAPGREAFPWSLSPHLPAARQIVRIARQIFPALMGPEATDAA